MGKCCVIKCFICGALTKALWGSGFQVSLLSFLWLKRNIVDFDIRNIAELLDANLQIEGVVGNVLPYMEYVIPEFQMGTSKLSVPFLVTKEHINRPLISYNVIETLTKRVFILRIFNKVLRVLLRTI